MTNYADPNWLCIHRKINHECEECANPARDSSPKPTMTSLQRIEGKIELLLASQAAVITHLNRLEEKFGILAESQEKLYESQGKILAAVDSNANDAEVLLQRALNLLRTLTEAVAKIDVAVLLAKEEKALRPAQGRKHRGDRIKQLRRR